MPLFECVSYIDVDTAVVTDGVAWSVSRSVCHDREPCKNG